MIDSLQEIQESLRSREVTVTEILESYLGRIAKDKHNVFVHVFEESARNKASQLDAKIENGDSLGRLFGAVISVKDNICYAQHPVHAGSKILEGYVSPYSATVVQKLIDEDAIIIGSTNMDEFGMGSTSTSGISGPVDNAIDPERVAGGSSGGAAVSVALDYCLLALGSDTGGSVRQPASFNNVIGYKPAYGTLSRYGLIAYGSSFDVVGLISRSLDAIAIVNMIASGRDMHDATSIDLGPQRTDDKISFAYIDEMFDDRSEYLTVAKDYIQKLSSDYAVSNVQFDMMKYLVPTYYVLTTAEASSNLSRYDGVRYGYRSDQATDLHSMYTKTRTEGFGLETKRRIMSGMFVLSEGYFDAYYTKAQKVRQMIKTKIDEILDVHTYLIMPVTVSDPWRKDECPSDPTAVYLSDVFTVLANLTGHQALSIPLASQSNSPYKISLQILTKKERTIALFDLAHKLQ